MNQNLCSWNPAAMLLGRFSGNPGMEQRLKTILKFECGEAGTVA
jgi:hypothetical protein